MLELSVPCAQRREWSLLKISPHDPQAIVDNMLKEILVGPWQRQEIKHPRGFKKGPFGYNEGPTSSCHTFCWKARHYFDVPFF
jgi:hypothetical protein